VEGRWRAQVDQGGFDCPSRRRARRKAAQIADPDFAPARLPSPWPLAHQRLPAHSRTHINPRAHRSDAMLLRFQPRVPNGAAPAGRRAPLRTPAASRSQG
jgi:hypothetical protein